MYERFKLVRGKYGMYFYDTLWKKSLTLQDVLDTLNDYMRLLKESIER